LLTFRNIDADPADPVELWPYEGLVTALERGLIHDWARINQAIKRNPWGPVARDVEAYLQYADPEAGVTALMRELIARARRDAEAAERQAVAAEVRKLIDRSGLSRAEFAAAIGSSSSRLSTYANGKVTPSAALLLRMRHVADRSTQSRSADLH
jgi:DNA-binding transcriptional regulator YiaG